jgi:hypothetical protein
MQLISKGPFMKISYVIVKDEEKVFWLVDTLINDLLPGNLYSYKEC